MGMTDLRPYFTRIITHNSVNVHRIPTKLGTEIRCNESFKCAKFQLDWSMHSCSMTDFAQCAKRSRRKNEERKNQNFGRSYLRNDWGDFLQILYVGSPTAWALVQQIWFQSDKGSRSYKGVKITFTFFLLIYSQCGAPASWAARHTTVCLGYYTTLHTCS